MKLQNIIPASDADIATLISALEAAPHPNHLRLMSETVLAVIKRLRDTQSNLVTAQAELARFRGSGVTDELLRSNGGAIKVSEGCEIAIAGTTQMLHDLKTKELQPIYAALGMFPPEDAVDVIKDLQSSLRSRVTELDGAIEKAKSILEITGATKMAHESYFEAALRAAKGTKESAIHWEKSFIEGCKLDQTFIQMIHDCLEAAGAPKFHPIKPGAEAPKPLTPQEKIAYIANNNKRSPNDAEDIAIGQAAEVMLADVCAKHLNYPLRPLNVATVEATIKWLVANIPTQDGGDQFTVCAKCASKPTHHPLCTPCQRNRTVIKGLKESVIEYKKLSNAMVQIANEFLPICPSKAKLILDVAHDKGKALAEQCRAELLAKRDADWKKEIGNATGRFADTPEAAGLMLKSLRHDEAADTNEMWVTELSKINGSLWETPQTAALRIGHYIEAERWAALKNFIQSIHPSRPENNMRTQWDWSDLHDEIYRREALALNLPFVKPSKEAAPTDKEKQFDAVRAHCNQRHYFGTWRMFDTGPTRPDGRSELVNVQDCAMTDAEWYEQLRKLVTGK